MRLGVDLERDRLERRAVRLDLVISALRARARAYREAEVPRPLRSSLADFETERNALRARITAASKPDR